MYPTKRMNVLKLVSKSLIPFTNVTNINSLHYCHYSMMCMIPSLPICSSRKTSSSSTSKIMVRSMQILINIAKKNDAYIYFILVYSGTYHKYSSNDHTQYGVWLQCPKKCHLRSTYPPYVSLSLIQENHAIYSMSSSSRTAIRRVIHHTRWQNQRQIFDP